MAKVKRIGVLALQGAFSEHCEILKKVGAKPFEIRSPLDLKKGMDGLVLPGGESTVQGKLLRELGMFQTLRQWIGEGLPVYGTCAGLILLARRIENDDRCHFGLMDITARRNAYGRQLGSFSTEADFAGTPIPMSFIRAPYIAQAGEQVELLAVVNDRIVAARERNMMVTAFHPEVTGSTTVHESFLDMINPTGKKPWSQ